MTAASEAASEAADRTRNRWERNGAKMAQEWMNHPAMKDMDPVKVELIRTAAARTAGKSGNALAAAMMTLITSAGRRGIRFTPQETSLILEILKEGRSDEEKRQIDSMVSLVTAQMRRQADKT